MSAKNIRMMCPNLRCRSILNVPINARGKIVRCSRCGFRVKVPAPKEADAGSTQSAATNNQ